MKVQELDRGDGPSVCHRRALWEWSHRYVHRASSTPSAALAARDRRGKGRQPSGRTFRYAHAMGNSTGDLYGQWQAIYKYRTCRRLYQDWIDRGILQKDAKA